MPDPSMALALRSLSVDDKLQMNANPSDEFSKFASPIQWDEDSLEERHPSIRHLNTDHSRSTTAEEDMRQFVPPKYWDYSDIFTHSTFDSLPDHSEFDHAIDLDDSFKPQRGKIYPISPREQKSSTNSSKRILHQAAFDPQNLHRPPLSSLLRKWKKLTLLDPIPDFDPFKTIVT